MKKEIQKKGKGKRIFLIFILLISISLTYFYCCQDDYDNFFMKDASIRIQDQSMPSELGCRIKLNWHKGARQLYHLDFVKIDQTYPSALEGQVEDHDNYALQIHMEISCTLNIRIFEKFEDTIYLGCQLSNVNVRAGESSDSLLRDNALEALFRPFFLIEMHANGLPEKFYFPPHLDSQSRTSLSEIIYAVQTVVPTNEDRAPIRKWRSQEQHAFGKFKVEYMLEPHSCNALSKQNIRCTVLNDLDQSILKTDNFQFRGIIEHSNHQITLSGDDASWIESYAGEESFAIFVSQHALWYRLQTKILLSPDRQQLDPNLFIWETHMPVREIIDSFASNDNNKKKVSQTSKIKFSERVSLASKLEMFQKDILENASQDVILEHINAFEQFLTKYPEEAGFIPDLIKNLNIEGRTAESIILILEMIGHESAQSAISDIFLDYNQAPDIRLKATVSAGGIASPTPVLIDRLFQLISQEQNRNDIQGLRRSDEAILSLGLLNKALYKDNNSVSANFIHNRLIGMLQNNSDERHMIACIQALGNATMPEGTDYLLPFIDSDVPLIRKSAIQALGKIDVQSNDARNFSENDQNLKPEIARSSSQSLSGNVLSRFVNLYYNEKEPEIREEIIKSIINRNEPQAKDFLDEILHEETDEKIVDLIHSYFQMN